MTHQDDRCDFCDGDCSQGTDRAKDIRGRLWCGECRQGRQFLWGKFTDGEIVQMRDEYRAKYEADPIDWDRWYGRSGHEPGASREPMSADESSLHLQRLTHYDMWMDLNAVLEDRGLAP